MYEKIKHRLAMKDTEKGCWHYVLSYVLLGSGTLIVLEELLTWAYPENRVSLITGLIAIWFGVMLLTVWNLPKRRQRSDVTESR